MDVHLYLSILLNYYSDFDRWSTARLLCKESKAKVDGMQMTNDTVGARIMIATNVCMVCDKRTSDPSWIGYPCDEPFVSGKNRRFIVCCKTWQCRVSAVCSLLSDCENDNIFLLKSPLSFGEKITVPRSDGSVTEGASYNSHSVVKKDGRWFVFVFWFQDDGPYYKVVPLSHYTSDEPSVMKRNELFSSVVEAVM